jgi:hypothetical protein
MSLSIVIIIFLFIFSLIALYKEKYEQENAYILSIPDKKDTIQTIFKKINYALEYETTTIKWRRSLISSFLILFILFAFVYARIPTPKEIILTFSISYMIFYFNFITYTNIVSNEAIKYGKQNIRKIKKYINEK